MKKKLFIILLITIFGFIISTNIIGCKKNKAKDTASIEENDDDDIDSDDDSDSD
ncbi:MAG: hypothetical protein V1874_16915 [Spirochaetota bacterium]